MDFTNTDLIYRLLQSILLIERLFGFRLYSYYQLHLPRLYSNTPTYPTVLTIVHSDSTPSIPPQYFLC
jgi:hypothetical protein